MKWFYENWNQQKAWLDSMLSNSTNDWTAVVVHYPAVCSELKDVLDHYGVDLCIVGHTHWELISQNPSKKRNADGGGAGGFKAQEHCSASMPCEDTLLEVVTGGGGGISAESQATHENSMYGFVDFSLSATQVTARIVNHAGLTVGGTWSLPPRPKGAGRRRKEAGGGGAGRAAREFSSSRLRHGGEKHDQEHLSRHSG